MEKSHTEERIDRLEGELREFRVETNARFDKIDARFEKIDARFEKIDARFERVDDRFGEVTAEFVAVRKEIKEGFESQQRTMFHGALMLCGTMIGCFGAIAGLIAAVV